MLVCVHTHTFFFFYGNTGCILAACTYTSCLSFSFSLSISLPFFQTHTHTHTPLWGDWCCKLAWVCRWSGCDYCLAPRQLWWWHSVLWAPLAWARSKHNQAVHSLYLATVHICGLDTTATRTRHMCLNFGCAFRFWCGSVNFTDDKKETLAVYFVLLEVKWCASCCV